MADAEATPSALHILVLPLQQEGHINGMLRLAQALVAAVPLERHTIVVTFAYPARFHSLALARGQLSPPPTSSSSSASSLLRIEVVDDGLPSDETHTLSPAMMFTSAPVFKHGVTKLLDRLLLLGRCNSSDSTPLPPDDLNRQQLPPLSCIVADTFLPWVQDLADAAKLPRVDFWTSSAAVYSMGTQISRLVSEGVIPLPKSCWANPERMWKAREAPLIRGVPGLPPFPATDLPASFVQPQDPFLPFILAAFRHVRKANAILIHSVYELESQVFDALQAQGFPTYAVGPFLQEDMVPSASNSSATHECLRWLDTQTPFSVVFIAFGTVATLSASEMHSLALGLEASRRPFLWVIRPDAVGSSLEEALPDGFLHRTCNQGSGLIVPWAPQREVLRHRSVGVFFSHCGWNSTLESMWEGVPMVACPRFAEQCSNTRWIVEKWKTGVELEREDDGGFTAEAVRRGLAEVLVEKAELYKKQALQEKHVARSAVQEGGSSHANLITFLRWLSQYASSLPSSGLEC